MHYLRRSDFNESDGQSNVATPKGDSERTQTTSQGFEEVNASE